MTSDNIATLTATGTWFVKFYAPWCRACKEIAPAWRELGEAVESDPNYHVGEVDCTASTDLCGETFNVEFYPTLKVFKNGEVTKEHYNGPQGKDYLLEYLKSDHVDHVSKAVELTDDNFEELIVKGVWFVDFYAPWCGHCKNLAPIWSDLAEKLKNDPNTNIGSINCVESNTICNQYDLKGYPVRQMSSCEPPLRQEFDQA